MPEAPPIKTPPLFKLVFAVMAEVHLLMDEMTETRL